MPLLPLPLNNTKLHILKQKNNNKLKKANLSKKTKLIMRKLIPMLRLKKHTLSEETYVLKPWE
jgi:hypothetical protein